MKAQRALLPAIMVGALAMVALLIAAAHGGPQPSRGNHLEGTWIYTVTIPGLPLDTFKGVVTFFPGGSVVEHSWAPGLLTNTGAGQGVWAKVRDHEFAFSFAFLWFDKGQLFVLGKAHATVKIDGDEATGGVTFETLDTLDPGGTVLGSGTGTLDAIRFAD